MPIFSILKNSSFTAVSFSLSKRRAHAWVGGPFVTIWCSTLCLLTVLSNLGTKSSGNSYRIFECVDVAEDKDKPASEEGTDAVCKLKNLLPADKRRRPLRSIKMLCLMKKSAPRIGRVTSAIWNSCWYCLLTKIECEFLRSPGFDWCSVGSHKRSWQHWRLAFIVLRPNPCQMKVQGKIFKLCIGHFYVRLLLHGVICVTKCEHPSNCFFLFFFFLSFFSWPLLGYCI